MPLPLPCAQTLFGPSRPIIGRSGPRYPAIYFPDRFWASFLRQSIPSGPDLS
ncbi:hypothetical protein AtDm6_0592 [Acetobacter tropicalis]|uniref:Uncharacterized protein n=1 Tax=Acetobacter tropicalis TaxID=104102 RepID=A0A094YVF4_9PROT|nr:hypothetical protein AtDm6_0592 [Acetobacter tropicalis]